MSEEKTFPANRQRRLVIYFIILIILSAVITFVAARNNNGQTGDAVSTAIPSASPSAPGSTPSAAAASASPAAASPGSAGSVASAPSTSAPVKAAQDVKYTAEQAMKLAQEAAKKQFGDDAVVFPAGDTVGTTVNIDGKDRICYMFGADSMSKIAANGGSTMRGLYHFDANTGEIFDNQNGEMKKIN